MSRNGGGEVTKVGDEVFMPSSYVNSNSTSGYGTVIAVETETKYLIRYRNGGQAWVSQWHLDNFGKTGGSQ